LLVRADTGRLLTQSDMVTRADENPRYVALDEVHQELVAYDPAAGRYEGDATRLALEGEYAVRTPQGEVTCRPAFEHYARLCRRYPPHLVEEICWVNQKQIEQTAHMIWHSRPVSYYAWSGHEQHTNSTQTARAISLLYALTGCFDLPGGNVLFPSVQVNAITGEELPAARHMAPALGRAERPLGPARWNHVTSGELYRAMKYYGKKEPEEGLSLALRTLRMTATSYQPLERQYDREWADEHKNPAKSFANKFAVQADMDRQAREEAKRGDANSWIYIAQALNLFRTGDGDNLRDGLAKIKAKVLFIPSKSDLLMFPDFSRKAYALMKSMGKNVDIFELQGDGGHYESAHIDQAETKLREILN
jgi:anaerobic selenocysteine-containing dehydrogenase